MARPSVDPAESALIDSFLGGSARSYGRAAAAAKPSRKAKRRAANEYSDADKLRAREGLADLIVAALERLEDPDGMREFLISLQIHGHFSPGQSLGSVSNAALAALQAPGEMVGTKSLWGSIPKGEKASCVVISHTFWPRAAWKGSQFLGGQLLDKLPPIPAPDLEECARLSALWIGEEKRTAALDRFCAGRLEDMARITGEPVERTAEPEPVPGLEPIRSRAELLAAEAEEFPW